jgi:hypothetical protein
MQVSGRYYFCQETNLRLSRLNERILINICRQVANRSSRIPACNGVVPEGGYVREIVGGSSTISPHSNFKQR